MYWDWGDPMSAGQLSKPRREALGRMLTWIRIQRGMTTRTALQAASGVSLVTLKNLEEGRTSKPREEILLQLDEALGLPPQTLTSYARGVLTPDAIRRLIGEDNLPVWIRTPKPNSNTSNPLAALVEVLGSATIEQQRKVTEAAQRILAEDESDG